MSANVWSLTAFIGRWRKHFKSFQCKRKATFHPYTCIYRCTRICDVPPRRLRTQLVEEGWGWGRGSRRAHWWVQAETRHALESGNVTIWRMEAAFVWWRWTEVWLLLTLMNRRLLDSHVQIFKTNKKENLLAKCIWSLTCRLSAGSVWFPSTVDSSRQLHTELMREETKEKKVHISTRNLVLRLYHNCSFLTVEACGQKVHWGALWGILQLFLHPWDAWIQCC